MLLICILLGEACYQGETNKKLKSKVSGLSARYHKEKCISLLTIVKGIEEMAIGSVYTKKDSCGSRVFLLIKFIFDVIFTV